MVNVSVVVVVVAAWQWDPSYGRRTCRLCDVTPTPGTMTSLVNGSLSNDDGDVPVLTNRRQLSKQQVEGQRQRLDTVMMLTLLSSAGTVRHCNNDTSHNIIQNSAFEAVFVFFLLYYNSVTIGTISVYFLA